MMRRFADAIIADTLAEVLPDAAVKNALEGREFPGNVYLVAIGKAGWQMAKAAYEVLGDAVCDGVVITKYDHVLGPIGGLRCFEAGHPVPDANSYKATQAALDLVANVGEGDAVLFLVSGGGSALFESPIIDAAELEDITQQLLRGGADINEMNTLRKRFSKVKGGKFALACAPANVLALVLSDVVGNPLDVIASGPAAEDESTCVDALAIAQKYQLTLSDAARECLMTETPKQLDNVESVIAGGVETLCEAAMYACRDRGFDAWIVSTMMEGDANDAALWLVEKAREVAQGRAARALQASGAPSVGADGDALNGVAPESVERPVALIAGGETVVHVRGDGLGGRNQQFALVAARELAGSMGIHVFSLGSDGTDGPTDAAGGYANGFTWQRIKDAGLDPEAMLANNDAYHALEACGGLIKTGPTGTNVNDVAVAFIL